AVIRRFLSGELDPADEGLAEAVGVFDAEEGDAQFRIEDLALRTQIPAPMLEALVRDGLLVGRSHEGELWFTEDDVAIVAGGLRVLETGLPLPELLALARRHHEATRQFATEAVELFDTYVRQPLRTADLPEDEREKRMVEAFHTLLPVVTELATYHFRRLRLPGVRDRPVGRDAGCGPDVGPVAAQRRLGPAVPRRVGGWDRVRVRPAELRELGTLHRRVLPGAARRRPGVAAGGGRAGATG